MYGIARLGVAKLEIKHVASQLAHAGPAETHAGRSECAQARGD
jgi:hypothetical protein